MIFQDFLSDASGDLLVQNGDLVVGPSDQQHIEDIISSAPGWWKQFPAIGVNIFQFLNSVGQEQTLEKQIILQLQSDGFTVTSPRASFDSNGKLIIQPNAVRN
jgi:hypothetical protein